MTWWGLGVGCVVVAVLLWALHWFPWEKFTGHRIEVPWSYVAGVSVLASVYSAWLAVAQCSWLTGLIGLWAIIVSGGLADLAAYGLDRLGGILMDWRTSRGKVGGDGRDGSGAIRPR